MVRSLGILAFLVVLAAALPGTALAVDPEAAVGGAGSKWFSGTLEQLSGENCSIIGGQYSETMLSAIGGYGGAPGGQSRSITSWYPLSKNQAATCASGCRPGLSWPLA